MLHGRLKVLHVRRVELEERPLLHDDVRDLPPLVPVLDALPEVLEEVPVQDLHLHQVVEDLPLLLLRDDLCSAGLLDRLPEVAVQQFQDSHEGLFGSHDLRGSVEHGSLTLLRSTCQVLRLDSPRNFDQPEIIGACMFMLTSLDLQSNSYITLRVSRISLCMSLSSIYFAP